MTIDLLARAMQKKNDSYLSEITLLSKVNDLTTLSVMYNRTIVVDEDITLTTENININGTNLLKFTDGTITLNGTAKLVIQCPIIAGNKLIFIDNTTLDVAKLQTFTEDSVGIYIKNNSYVYLNWFYQATPLGNSWFNVASRSVGNWSKLVCHLASSFNFKGVIYPPMFFDGNYSILYSYGVTTDYPDSIVVKTDYNNRYQFEVFNFRLDASTLTDKIIYGLQVGGSQYAKFERILIVGTAGSPETQKLDWGLLIKPLHPSSQDIDHTIFYRVRCSNCGVKIETNDSITRGNITELYFKDCAFGNNGTQTDAPLTITNITKSAFSINFDGLFISQGMSAKAIDITGIKHMDIQKISQEYYRGTATTDPNTAQYAITIKNSRHVTFRNNRWGDNTKNNFIKLINTTDSLFDNFDFYTADRNTDIISTGDMIVLNIDSDSIGNKFSNTKSSLIYKTNQTQWDDFRDGSIWDRIDSSKLVGDASGNSFKEFFGVTSDKTPYINKSDFFATATKGTSVSFDVANSKINISRTSDQTQNFVNIPTKSKFVTIIMKCKLTDTVKASSPVFLGDSTITKQKIVQTYGSFVNIRAFLYVPSKILSLTLYDNTGISTHTTEIEDLFIYDGIGGNFYNQLR